MKEPSNNWRKEALCVPCPSWLACWLGQQHSMCSGCLSALPGCSRTQKCSFVHALLHASTLGIYRMGVVGPVFTLHRALQWASLPRVAAVAEAVAGAPAQRGDVRRAGTGGHSAHADASANSSWQSQREPNTGSSDWAFRDDSGALSVLWLLISSYGKQKYKSVALCYSFQTDWRFFSHTIRKAFFKANTDSVV